jgi:hypothetical protein
VRLVAWQQLYSTADIKMATIKEPPRNDTFTKLYDYQEHPEARSLGPDENTCTADTRGS